MISSSGRLENGGLAVVRFETGRLSDARLAVPRLDTVRRSLSRLAVVRLAGLGALVTLLPWTVAGQEWREGESRTEANSHIQGQVVDRVTGDPITDVGVLLHSRDGSGITTYMADARGRFLFSPIPAGVYEIQLIRIGYTTVHETVLVEPSSEVRLVVEMAPEALALDGLVVSTTRRSRLESNGFYDRRERRSGTFFTRDDIELRNPTYLSDVLRLAPMLRTEWVAGGRGAMVLGRGGCRPAFFLDGMRMTEGGMVERDVHPNDLEGIEVYSGVSAPIEFTSPCGSVVMWTRQPGPGEPRSRIWLRTFLGVGFVLGSFLLTR